MLYARLPTGQEAAAAGFELSDYFEEVEVWPENALAFSLFEEMSTQWRGGFSGPTGLDYAFLFQLLDRHGLTGSEWWQAFHDIRTMEAVALSTFNKPT